MNETPFDEFRRNWRSQYKQDQHVTVIGPTGCGKTTLAQELIKPRGHVVALGVKHVDETMENMVKNGDWHRVQKWSRRPRSATRVAVWPKENDLDKIMEHHQKTFGDVFRSVFKIGSWSIWMDELTYLTDHIGLKSLVRRMYILSRSNNISLIGSAQRPAHIPLEAYSQASHLILFRTGDERDLTRLGSLNGTSAKQVANTVAELPEHTFLHVNLNTREQTISRQPVKSKGRT